jgi:hypothetical protein
MAVPLFRPIVLKPEIQAPSKRTHAVVHILEAIAH